MNHRKSTSFYVETLLLTLFFLCITAILVHMFTAARKESLLAHSLTQTQQIAQNVSAVFYGTDSPEDFWQMMEASSKEGTATVLTVDSNGEQTSDGPYTLSLMLDVSPAESGLGQMAQLTLSVRRTTDEAELFSDQYLRYLPQ